MANTLGATDYTSADFLTYGDKWFNLDSSPFYPSSFVPFCATKKSMLNFHYVNDSSNSGKVAIRNTKTGAMKAPYREYGIQKNGSSYHNLLSNEYGFEIFIFKKHINIIGIVMSLMNFLGF